MTLRPAKLGTLALVLHHHLPYVRHPEHPFFLEERWLFEAITETYLPLIRAWRRLERDGVPFCMTVSLSPPLISMLRDELLIQRYVGYAQSLIELCAKEIERTAHDVALQKVARFYAKRIKELFDLFNDLDRDIVGEYRRLQEAGHLEVITCSATHAFLPLMNRNRAAQRVQIELAVSEYKRVFGCQPKGIWLAECGYEPGIDELLAEAGLRYFFVDTHGLMYASSRPVYGVYAPIACAASGVAAFGRDVESSKQVWSAHEGYPGDADYREYYRDIGFDLEFDYIRPYIHPDGIRINTGIKYHRITGQTEQKAIYDPERAVQRANEHAAHFLANRQAQVEHLSRYMDRAPNIVSPYDAELFGHWWFEGPDFIEALCRQIAHDQTDIELTTPSRYLNENPVLQSATPALSSWGDGGYATYWCNSSNEWIYRYLHDAAAQMVTLAQVAAQLNEEKQAILKPALDQAARELLLAQSSDWAFIMRTGTTVEYAVERTVNHLSACRKLFEAISLYLDGGPEPDAAYVEQRRSQWGIFPELDYHIFIEAPDPVVPHSFTNNLPPPMFY